MKKICVTVLLLFNLWGCSYDKTATSSDENILIERILEERNYKNIYNEHGKLEMVIISGDIFNADLYEYHYFYKNDTVLFKKEGYFVQSDGRKILSEYYEYEDDKNTVVSFEGNDTTVWVTQYENGRVINEKRSYSGVEYSYVYKYDSINDTLITYVFDDNVLFRSEKKIGNKEFFYDPNELVASKEKIQIDKDNYVSLWIRDGIIDSSFYYLDREVKTVTQKIDTDIDTDINKEYVIVDDDKQIYSHTVTYEYDEFGNVIKEILYVKEYDTGGTEYPVNRSKPIIIYEDDSVSIEIDESLILPQR